MRDTFDDIWSEPLIDMLDDCECGECKRCQRRLDFVEEAMAAFDRHKNLFKRDDDENEELHRPG